MALFSNGVADAVSSFQGLFGQALVEGKKALTVGGVISQDAAAAIEAPPKNGAEVQAPLPSPAERESAVPGIVSRNPIMTVAIVAGAVLLVALMMRK